MLGITRFEVGMAIAGAAVALLAWPIGDLAGSVGKMLITFGALGALLVSIISILVYHSDMDEVALKVFRNEVAFFLPFGLFAVIVMVLTF